MIVPLVQYVIMSSRKPIRGSCDVPHETISRRRLLAVGGAVAVGSLAGCLNRVASVVTNTEASPAAVFAGTDWNDDDTEVTFTFEDELLGEPHVARLTPTLGERVELEGWVTSSAVMAQDYNSSRSNKQRSRAADEDSDGDGIDDLTEEEADELLAYLGGKPIVAERFTVCLPDAEVPGGNGSIREEVTPERLIAYLTGDNSVAGLSKADSKVRAVGGGGDCDDSDDGGFPGAVCGTTPHFVAEMTGPVATGGGLVAERTVDGHVVVANTPSTAGEGPSMMVCPVEGEPFVPEGFDAWGKRAGGGPPATMEAQGRLSSATVVQVMVQPPDCPEPFPALLYVSRGLSDGQLVYSGGWIIDDAALYGDSMTVLSMAGETQVAGIECCFDYNSDRERFGEVVRRSVSGERALRGARVDSGTLGELVDRGVLSIDTHDIVDVITSRGGETRSNGNDGESGEDYRSVTHVALDAPVLHLVATGDASESVKFKAGAELSKTVN